VCTDGSDPDARLFAMAREVVGAQVPIVSVLDLHAIVSQRMIESADVLVAFRTNPHVDPHERGVECAAVMHELLGGRRAAVAFLRLPLVAPQVTQLTAVGPYVDAIARAQACIDDRVLNVSGCCPSRGRCVCCLPRVRTGTPPRGPRRYASRSPGPRRR
jgi:microcystin degradation protein MlrC